MRTLKMTSLLITFFLTGMTAFSQTDSIAMETMPDGTKREISADFPFESKYVEVKGSKMHYIDEGEGDVILFLHGNPSASYLWRNIIPHLKGSGRCIAVDLIGMGKSDQPDIEYGYTDEAAYLEAFIDSLGLKDITLVIHDWGAMLGFDYANRHRDNVKAIAFMEGAIQNVNWDGMPRNIRMGIKMMKGNVFGPLLVESVICL